MPGPAGIARRRGGARFELAPAGTVTHLVVEPAGRIGLVGSCRLTLSTWLRKSTWRKEGVRLCGIEAEFRHLDAAEETLAEFVPGYQVPVQLQPGGWRDRGRPGGGGRRDPADPGEAALRLAVPDAGVRRGEVSRQVDFITRRG